MVSEKAKNLLALLEFHKPTVMNSTMIGAIIGVSNPEVRRLINELRTEEVPVCSTKRGYFISENPADIQETIRSLEGRIKSIKGAAMGMRECLLRVGGPAKP